MASPLEFPIPKPERLPLKISPCPIVEAVVEIRFTSTSAWRNLPGMFYPHVRERYPVEKELPLASLPEEIRAKEASLTYQPLLQYIGEEFRMQFGPRGLSLVTGTHDYPGWSKVEQEMDWLLGKVRASGIISETERVGLRYVDFFPGDVWPLLKLGVRVGDSPLESGELSTTAVLRHGALRVRLKVSSGAFLNDGNATHRGSVLDLDVWEPLASESSFSDGLDRIRRLHQVSKEVFFGLLEPDYLATLHPEYPAA